jgi:hypothetical protein
LANLRRNLIGALRKEFQKEIRRSVTRIDEAVAPYSRFVRAETARADGVIEDLSKARLEINHLKQVIKGF